MSGPVSTTYDFRGLTPAQSQLIALQGWRIGSKLPDGSIYCQPGKSTVRKLIERGLIVPRKQQERFAGGLTMTVTEYDVPLDVHIAFCMHVSRRNKDGDFA